jgi:hypothetical protein
MSGAGIVLLLIGFLMIGIALLVVLGDHNRSCLIFLVGLAGLVMLIIGVIFLARETKIDPTTTAALHRIFTL